MGLVAALTRASVDNATDIVSSGVAYLLVRVAVLAVTGVAAADVVPIAPLVTVTFGSVGTASFPGVVRGDVAGRDPAHVSSRKSAFVPTLAGTVINNSANRLKLASTDVVVFEPFLTIRVLRIGATDRIVVTVNDVLA